MTRRTLLILAAVLLLVAIVAPAAAYARREPAQANVAAVTLALCALLVGILAGWLAQRFRYARANKVHADLALDREHLEYLRQRYEVQHVVDIDGHEYAVDDPEQHMVKGWLRAETLARRPKRG